MGKHKELENLFLNELVLEEERAYRAKRIIEQQQQVIEYLERILTDKELKVTQQDDKDCQTENLELNENASSVYASLPAQSANISTTHSTDNLSSNNENTRSERSITSTERVESSTSTENNSLPTQEMKNVCDETTTEKKDSVECLVGLLNPSVCQNLTVSTSVAKSYYPSHPRTSHSIVQITTSNQILRAFDRIQRRLVNMQEEISNTENDNIENPQITSQESISPINTTAEQSEETATVEMLAQLNKMGMQLKAAINELNWKIEGNRRFRDQTSRQRWKIARRYFTAEQAYFFLTSETEDSLS